MATDQKFKYDVAFSFLGQDEELASDLNERLKDRLSTFIYSDAGRQNELAGRDGADAFGRVFAEEARTVVILYRPGWSSKGFTEIEGTAIRNRAHEEGWDFATFIPLDEPPTSPIWVPRVRLWIGLKRFGVEQAATVIESRVQEAGGAPQELTVAAAAQRLIRERREAAGRKAFLNSGAGVEAAKLEFDRLFEEMKRVCSQSAGIITDPERQGGLISMKADGNRRAMRFHFDLRLNNSLQGFTLHRIEYDGSTRDRPYDYRSEFHFDFGPSGDYGWREGTEPDRGAFRTTSELIDDAAKAIIEAMRDKDQPGTGGLLVF